MGQENSVMFALRDLRTLESDRLAEEARVEGARRRAEEERRRAEEERRRAEEEARLLAERRADEAAAQMARALRESAGRNEQLENDVQTLRALVSAVQPPPRARAHWPLVLVGMAVLALAGVLWASRTPVVRERIVYTPAPVAPAPVVVAPVVHPVVVSPPPPRTEPPRPKRPAVHVHKTVPAVPSELPSILDCVGKKDPLCGTNL